MRCGLFAFWDSFLCARWGVPAALGRLCFAKPLWLATTARARPAGRPLPSRRPGRLRAAPCARHYRRDGRGLPAAPAAVSWWGRVKDCHAIARRASHTFTERESIAPDTSVARLFALRGANIRQQRPFMTSWHRKHASLGLACFRCHDVMDRCCWRMFAPRRANRRAAEVSGAIGSRSVNV